MAKDQDMSIRALRSKDDVAIDSIACLISVLVLIAVIYPLIYIVSSSFSEPSEVALWAGFCCCRAASRWKATSAFWNTAISGWGTAIQFSTPW